MFTSQHSSIGLFWAGMVLLLLPLAPAWGQTESIVLRNESQTAVQIHVTVVFQGQARQIRPVLLNPRATAPALIARGDKIITLYDARIPTRSLLKVTIQSSSTNQTYSIQPDLIPPKLKLVPVANPGP